MLLDCWSVETFKAFDIIDRETCSRILLSTRIAGLVSSNACTEVKLSVMTTREAIALLLNGAGLDAAAAPPAMVEV